VTHEIGILVLIPKLPSPTKRRVLLRAFSTSYAPELRRENPDPSIMFPFYNPQR